MLGVWEGMNGPTAPEEKGYETFDVLSFRVRGKIPSQLRGLPKERSR